MDEPSIETKREILNLVFPDLRYGGDPDIERYFALRREQETWDRPLPSTTGSFAFDAQCRARSASQILQGERSSLCRPSGNSNPRLRDAALLPDTLQPGAHHRAPRQGRSFGRVAGPEGGRVRALAPSRRCRRLPDPPSSATIDSHAPLAIARSSHAGRWTSCASTTP